MLFSQRTTDKKPSVFLAASPFLRVPASSLFCPMLYAPCSMPYAFSNLKSVMTFTPFSFVDTPLFSSYSAAGTRRSRDQIRNSKSEARNKSKIQILQCSKQTNIPKFQVSVIWILKIRKLFRISIFGFRIYNDDSANPKRQVTSS